MCAAVSSYYVCETYEFVQLYPHITSVKCTNVSSYLFVLHLWNVRMCAAVSSYYVCEMYEFAQLCPHIMCVKCSNVFSCLFILRMWNVWLYSCRVVSHFILRTLLISMLMYPAPAIRVMNFRVECGPHVAKDSRTELDFISVKWLDGHQLWIWSGLRTALFWDIPQHILVIFSSSWIFWPLKMGPIGCPETSVRNYHDTLRCISEERKSHLLRGGSLKSRTEATWKEQLMVWLKALIRNHYGNVQSEYSVSGLQFDSGTSHREVRSQRTPFAHELQSTLVNILYCDRKHGVV